MNLDPPPLFVTWISDRFIAAGVIGSPDLHVPAAIVQSFGEIREMPRADDIIGMEEVIKNRYTRLQ